MPEDKPSSNSGTLKQFEAGEYVVDLLSGVLMLGLCGPFLSVMSYALPHSDPWRYGDPVIGIFPITMAWAAAQRLNSFTPWFLLGLAAVIGTVSRSVLIVYNLFPPARWLEKRIGNISLGQIRKWHRLSPEWDDPGVIVARLIHETPFHRIGNRDYAVYRAELLNPVEHACQKQYWYYELPLYLRASHFYALFYTFFWSYLLYGTFAYSYIYFRLRAPFYPPGFLSWLGILTLSFVLLIGLFEEVILHGAAFATIDAALYKEINKRDGA